MKVAYIGTKDQLWETFLERMDKEGNDVCLLASGEFSQGMMERVRHRYYRVSLQGGNLGKVLKSISPDWVVFAGVYFMDITCLEREGEGDVALLAQTL